MANECPCNGKMCANLADVIVALGLQKNPKNRFINVDETKKTVRQRIKEAYQFYLNNQ
jgi:hypothetical protein